MLIGVDFDNTVVCYDQLFHRVAVEHRLIPVEVPVAKCHVRDYLRQSGKEEIWTELQGYIYGARMQEALAFPGVLDFFAHCTRLGVPVRIISHKTRYPFRGPAYDLHQAAYKWLADHGFFDSSRIGLSSRHVFFDLTKQGKLDRIAQVGCTHFIDDLPEFLSEPGFPGNVKRILFSPAEPIPDEYRFRCVTSWMEIDSLLLGDGMSCA